MCVFEVERVKKARVSISVKLMDFSRKEDFGIRHNFSSLLLFIGYNVTSPNLNFFIYKIRLINWSRYNN